MRSGPYGAALRQGEERDFSVGDSQAHEGDRRHCAREARVRLEATSGHHLGLVDDEVDSDALTDTEHSHPGALVHADAGHEPSVQCSESGDLRGCELVHVVNERKLPEELSSLFGRFVAALGFLGVLGCHLFDPPDLRGPSELQPASALVFTREYFPSQLF